MCVSHEDRVAQLTAPAAHTSYSAHTYAVCTTCQEVTCTNEDKMTSALSVGAYVQARRPYGACVEGALHMRRRQSKRMLPPAVVEEGEL